MSPFVEIKRTRVVHLGVDAYDVSIARPSKWGNPFKIGQDGTRDEVIDLYRQYLLGRPDLLAAIPTELKGKVLGCWCKPERCHGDVLAEIADGIPPEEPKRAAPPEQALLPGYKKYVRAQPKDYRAWRDARGQQIDAPTKRGGGSFGGKVIPPLVDRSGKPIRLGDFQVVRDLKGQFKVIDWSRPVFDEPESEEKSVFEDLGAAPRTFAIMGKEVYKSKNVQRAIHAMVALHRDKRDRLAGFPPDPAPQNDLAGKPIQIGSLSLARWARGPVQGTFTIVDLGREITHSRRFTDLPKCKNLKQAVAAFVLESRKRKTAPPKKTRAVGAPIAFDVPAGFGGSGGGGGFGGSFVPYAERTYPEPGSVTWKTCIALYARTGRWPRTADLIWGEGRPDDDGKIPEGFEKRPERLEREAHEARVAYLAAEEEAKKEPADDPAALVNLEKLRDEDRIFLNEILEHFGGTLESVMSAPGARKDMP